MSTTVDYMWMLWMTVKGAVMTVKNCEQYDSCWAFFNHEFSSRWRVYRHRQHVDFERATARGDTVDSACNGGLADISFASARRFP